MKRSLKETVIRLLILLGSLTPKIPESLIWLIFLHKFKLLVDRTAVLCYNTIIGQEGCVVYEIKN